MHQATYIQASREISRLYRATLTTLGIGPHLQVYRRERARIWRRYGLTW